MAKAKSTDPVKVAQAMEGLAVKSFTRRSDDAHSRTTSCSRRMYITDVAEGRAKKDPYSVENTGYTCRRRSSTIEPYVAQHADHGCQMKRPGTP